MDNSFFTGLDIGSTAIRAVVAHAEPSADGTSALSIVGASTSSSAGLSRGEIVELDAASHCIEQVVHAAGSQAGIDIDSVCVGISGSHIATLVSTGHVNISNAHHEVGRRDMNAAVEASRVIVLPPDRQILHAIPRSFSVDGLEEVSDPTGLRGDRLEVHTLIVHGAAAAVNTLQKCITGAGLDIGRTILDGLALGSAILSPDEKESGVCLLDIGGSTTKLAVFVCGAIYHSAVIPVGANHITNDIAYGLTVTAEEAERLKVEHGAAVAAMAANDEVVLVTQVGRTGARKLRRPALLQIIEPRMQELFQLVLDELSHADCSQSISAGVVITGGGSLLSGCADIAQRELGVPARVGRVFGLGGLTDSLLHPEYAAAIGLAQFGAMSAAAPETAGNAKGVDRSIWRMMVGSIKRSFPSR